MPVARLGAMTIVDRLTARVLPQRVKAVQAIILHTTGDTDLTKILAYYQSPDGLQPHYVIGLDGTVYRIADEGVVAYHAAILLAEAGLYARGWDEWSHWAWDDINRTASKRGGELPNYTQWRDTWRVFG